MCRRGYSKKMSEGLKIIKLVKIKSLRHLSLYFILRGLNVVCPQLIPELRFTQRQESS